MEHSTPLHKLPDGLTFPEDLRDRIAFDAERRQLTFRGFMTKYAHDELNGLAQDEQYRTAVQRLFVLSSEEFAPPTARRPSPWMLAGAAVGMTAVAALVAWTFGGTSNRNHDPSDPVQASTAAQSDQANSIAVARPAN